MMEKEKDQGEIVGEHEEAEKLLLEDDEDDLEFHMTFPSPGNPDDNLVQVNPISFDMPEPLVFLLGWGGCQDKHLTKYSKIYEDIGCITVRYTAPSEYVIFTPDKLKNLAQKLLDLITEMSLESSPVFFHVFSNTGASMYQFMSEAIVQEEEYRFIRDLVKGAVFDSAPGRRTPASLYKASAEMFGGSNRISRLIIPVAFVIAVYVWHLFRLLLGLITPGAFESIATKPVPFCYDFLKQYDEMRMPMLFIYSRDDDIIKAEDVQEVADAKEKQGCEVTKICYDNSPHVQHLRTNQASYISSIVSFVKKHIKGPDTSGILEEEKAKEQEKDDDKNE